MLNKLKYNSDKNKHNLIKANGVNINAISDFYNKINLYYDTDWQASELELFNEATSTTKDVLLPQKAKYEFSFIVNAKEQYLPFIHWNIIAKTVPEQDVRGVGEFTFTGLREIVLSTYQWQGITQLSTYAGQDWQWSGVFYPRNAPYKEHLAGYQYQITKPLPNEAYTQYTRVSSVRSISDLMPFYGVKLENGIYWVRQGATCITYWDYTLGMSMHP